VRNSCTDSDDFLGLLDRVVRSNAQEHGWRRPTWTREMLVATMRERTGIRIHPATMSRALATIRARRANPGRAWLVRGIRRRKRDASTSCGD
jgi:hypothetical protein